MGIDKHGLSTTQWKAAEMLASGTNVSAQKVAKACGVTADAVYQWNQDWRFKLAVLKSFEISMAGFRNERMGFVAKNLKVFYIQFEKELKLIDKNKLGVRALLQLITTLHAEMRRDAKIFTESKPMVELLAELGANEDEKINIEETALTSAEQRYLERREKEMNDSESKVIDIVKKQRKQA